MGRRRGPNYGRVHVRTRPTKPCSERCGRVCDGWSQDKTGLCRQCKKRKQAEFLERTRSAELDRQFEAQRKLLEPIEMGIGRTVRYSGQVFEVVFDGT